MRMNHRKNCPKLHGLLVVVLFLTISSILSAGNIQHFADLGDFRLQNGEVIYDCQMGYRCFGCPNADSSNVIINPSWFGGKSEHLANLIGGPEAFIDTTGFFIIVFDAFGNGISSSPSNSIRQSADEFPAFTIRDMVEAQKQVLQEELGLTRVYGAIGGSMGSFQIFEWLVCYPDFIQRALPYVCSPRLTSHDRYFIDYQMKLIETGTQYKMPEDELTRLLNMTTELYAHSPQYRVRKTPFDAYRDWAAKFETPVRTSFTPWNKYSQLRAMQNHDITRYFDHSMEKTAQHIQSESLMIVSGSDHIVRPEPAMDLADLMGCEIIILDNDCGHLAIGCEMERCTEIVHAFFGMGRIQKQ